jgi:hypothetical protein
VKEPASVLYKYPYVRMMIVMMMMIWMIIMRRRIREKNKKILILHAQMLLTSECYNMLSRWRTVNNLCN